MTIPDTFDAPEIRGEHEMMCSIELDKLSDALCRAQGDMRGASKDSENPFFRSKYADLAAVWDDIREPFAMNDISVIQMPVNGLDHVTVITQFTHKSGQWIRSKLSMVPTKKDPQGIGSCITYARRYALAAMAGVYQIDDDANDASGKERISTEKIDMDKVKTLSKKAMELVDEDSEDYTQGKATEILEQLTNDERVEMQKILKLVSPEGTRKTYYSVFRDHLKLEREAQAA